MWLVTKGARNGAGGTVIEPALAETLRIWYSGVGDHRDEEPSLLLVRHARQNKLWLACDCQGDGAAPMLSPALLTEADTYYLRRLTGHNRAEHRLDCPFFREQAMTSERTERAPARNTPDGFFAVLKPAPLALAQAPDEDARPRDSASHGTPRLAKLLWRLLELSGRAGIPAVETAARTIAAEFVAIRALAEQIPVAPGIPLARVLFTHPRDWTSKRVFAVLRELSKSWPKGHEPQAFMLIFAGKIHEHSIETSEGLIDIATRVRHPETRDAPIGGPDLTLVAIGNHPDVHGYAAQRAWAQPVHNGHRFIPVDSNFDREIVDALIAARRILASDNIALSAGKPLFDRITPNGAVRPPWLVTLKRDGTSIDVVIDPKGTLAPDPIRYQALSFCGPVIDIDAANIDQLTLKLRRQSERAGNPEATLP
jgi:hypothetical protein